MRGGYSAAPAAPKLVFVRPLVADARARLTRPALHPIDRHGGPKAMISADTMRSLPDHFADIDDPRRRQGRRHPLPVVLAIAAGATLCGARGYKAMAEWAADLSPRARERFRRRHRGGRYDVPSEYVIRDVLVRVDPDQFDRAPRRFDAAIAIDGKTMRNAIYADTPPQWHLLKEAVFACGDFLMRGMVRLRLRMRWPWPVFPVSTCRSAGGRPEGGNGPAAPPVGFARYCRTHGA